MDLSTAIAFFGELIALVGVLIPILSKLNKIANGTKCQHRCDMLETYYKNRDEKTIRQYELENFIMLYEAYKSLKGNSFIDKIHDEVITSKVMP